MGHNVVKRYIYLYLGVSILNFNPKSNRGRGNKFALFRLFQDTRNKFKHTLLGYFMCDGKKINIQKTQFLNLHFRPCRGHSIFRLCPSCFPTIISLISIYMTFWVITNDFCRCSSRCGITTKPRSHVPSYGDTIKAFWVIRRTRSSAVQEHSHRGYNYKPYLIFLVLSP